jgi:hypothetical protein
MVTKWTNIKSVLFELERFTPKDLYDEQRSIEDCMRAVDFIGAVPTYQQAVRFIKVENYKACLPLDCLQIIQVAYKHNWHVNEQDLADIREMLGYDNDPSLEDSTLPLQVLLDSKRFTNQWRPLRVSTNSFTLAVHCENSVNIGHPCQYEYTVTPDGSMTFNFKTGYICVAYYCYPKDCHGNFLIPDVEDYKEALKNFCLMTLWELRWNMKEEGASERYMKYQQLWGIYKAKAEASIRMPGVSEAQNLTTINNKLIPNTRRFNNFFSTMNHEENLDMSGFSSHYYYRN